MRRSTISVLVSAISLTLVLTACGAQSDRGAASTVAPETTKDPSGPKGGGSKDPVVDPADDPTEVSVGGGGEGQECLVGTWLIDPQSVVDITIAALGLTTSGVDMDLNPQVTVTGDGLMTFTADGTATTEYRQQLVDMTLYVEGAEVHTSGWTHGTLISSFTATDTEITTSDGDASGIEMEIASTLNGEPFDTGDQTAMTLATWELGNTSEYTCGGDTLELTPLAAGFDTALFTAHYTRQ